MGYRLLVSSSVAPFRKKAERAWNIKRYKWPRDIFRHCVFFGLYHWVDYLKFLIHLGPKSVFWCGSDLLQLKHWVVHFLQSADHYVENDVERERLLRYQVVAEVRPSFVDEILEISFKPSKTPHVFMCCHREREDEYGMELVNRIAARVPKTTFHIYGIKVGRFSPNIIYHGKVPEKQFNEEIKQYQAGIRLNEFDGNSEVTMKSVLMGQYPITRIKYPHIDHCETTEGLIGLLRELKNKKGPNYGAREFWLNNINKYPWTTNMRKSGRIGE